MVVIIVCYGFLTQEPPRWRLPPFVRFSLYDNQNEYKLALRR